MKRLLLIFALLLGLAGTAIAATDKAGDPAEQLYQQGKALLDAKDYAAALAKLRPAAEKGHKKAQYRLGRCYDKGHGVEEDNATAVKWYQKSAAQGYAKAEYQLARAYAKGKGVRADERKARSWAKKAVAGKKHGQEIMDDMRKKAAHGDDTAARLLRLLNQ